MAASQSRDASGGEWPIRTALAAGSVAAVAASLVSLPLRSPHDTLFNSATVTLGALVAGLLSGLAWRALDGFASRPRIFAALWAAAFVLVVAASVGAEAWGMDRAVSFVAPLALIVFTITGAATAGLSRSAWTRRWWMAVVAVLAALALGFGLMGQGDQESGRLELPPRAEVLQWH